MNSWKGKENEFKFFEQAIRGLMKCWSTLRICVENHFGGATSEQKKDVMIEGLIAKFKAKGNTINPTTVIDYLYNFFEQKMMTDCEDGSIEDISELIIRLCAECYEGDTALAEVIIEDSKKPLESPGFREYLEEDDYEEYDGEDDENENDDDDVDEETKMKTLIATALTNQQNENDDESGEYDPNQGEYDSDEDDDESDESSEYDPNNGEYDSDSDSDSDEEEDDDDENENEENENEEDD